MSEKKLIVDQLQFSYEGLMEVPEIYKIIDSYFYEQGYDKYERLNTEDITPTGRQISWILEPSKNITDYFKLHIKIKANFYDVQDREIKKQGVTIKIQHGLLRINIDGYIESDRYRRWVNTPVQWFIRTLFDKYFFEKNYSTSKKWLKADIDRLITKIKDFLNVQRKYEGQAT